MFRSLTRRRRLVCWAFTTAVAAALGCQTQRDLTYMGQPENSYYRAHATAIEYPAVVSPTPEELAGSLEPHTIRDLDERDVREMSLQEAIHLALTNSEIIRSAGQFLSPGNALLTSPDRTMSVFDPAIQDSGVLFGGRGVEAALAAFDATWSTSMIWGRNAAYQNRVGTPVQTNETAEFDTTLTKNFANGSIVQLGQSINYLGANNSPLDAFDSVYFGNVRMLYQLPLLAGAGTEFTRVAGPIGQSFGGITGVSQGVVIARINNDLALADFDLAVRNLLRDVEDTYWDLYLAYRNFDTAVVARNSSTDTWRLTKKQAGEILIPADEAQARSTLYQARAAAEAAQSQIYTSETRLRRLIGLPVNDGAVIRPSDEPVTAELIPDWYTSLSEALTQRVELRRQKWNIKSLELQLEAAKSLTRPRLDFLAAYRINGFGDDLLAYNSQQSIDSYYETLAANNQTGWNLGLQMDWPVGFRSAHAQVRNYELRLMKAEKGLAYIEMEIGQELAVGFQELARTHANMESNYLRYVATEENVRGLLPRVLTEDNVDVILRAYERRAQAEAAFYQSLVDYNKALTDLEYFKGTILAHNGVRLMEGGWVPEAYADAEHHAEGRAYGRRTRHLHPVPEPFVSGAPVGRVTFTTDEAAQLSQPGLAPAAEPAEERPYAPTPAPPADPPRAEPPLFLDGEPAAGDADILPLGGLESSVHDQPSEPAAHRGAASLNRPPADDSAARRSPPPGRTTLRSSNLYDAGIAP